MVTGTGDEGTLSAEAPASQQLISECSLSEPLDPCAIVIFGATGDLTARKLIPALFKLYRHHGLPKHIAIIGCGRTPLTDQEFRTKLEKSLVISYRALSDRASVKAWRDFSDRLFYCPVQYDDPTGYRKLGQTIQTIENQGQTRGNRLFYLALPPSLYQPVTRHIGQAGLNKQDNDGKNWVRLVIEKPFGRNLETAVELNQDIHTFFNEDQVFRIDHYLAKETVQNVLMFRFANAIFEPVWNRRYIESVSINVLETLGVEHRAGYYEQAGVLRDMFQNHMMQLLALTAMEPPSRFKAEQVRDERIKVFRSLRPFSPDSQSENLVLGQYGTGRQPNGETIRAYRDEPGVDASSLTPTFARMKVFLDNWRWQGVPFYLTSGKRLAEKITEISIQFKDVPHSMFRQVLGETIGANRLTLGIYPDEKISLTFQTKQPGARVCLRPVTMNFDYQQEDPRPVLEAYEKVLLDCILGDHMLFWRQDGVERCWWFLTPILTACEHCRDRGQKLHFYPAGGWGPDTAQAMGSNEIGSRENPNGSLAT